MRFLKGFIIVICLVVFTCGLAFGQSRQVDSLKNLLKTAPGDTTRVNILISLADKLKTSDMKTGFGYANEAESLAKKLHWEKGRVLAYIKMAAIDRNLLQYPMAMDFLDTALPISRQIRDKHLEARVYLGVANIYRGLSQSSQALDYVLKGLKIADQYGYQDLKAVSYSYLGYIYYTIGDLQKTRDYNLKSLELDIERHDIVNESIDLSNVGAIYALLHDRVMAVEYMKKGLALSKKIDNKDGITSSMANIASSFREIKDYVTAEKFADSCITLSHTNHLKGGEALGLLEKGEIYFATRRFKEALVYYQQAYKLTTEISYLDKQRDILLAISKIYDSIGQPVKAYEAYRKYVAIKDTLLIQENRKDITRMEMQFDFDAKEAAIKASQDKKDALAKQEIDKSSFERNLFIGGAILIAGVAVFMIFTARRLRKFNKLLSLQKSEISIEKEKSEQLGKVKDKLFSIISHDLRSPLVSMDAVLVLLNSDELSPDKMKAYTEDLSQMLRHNMELLDNLLYWATTQMRGMKINKMNVNIDNLINESIGLIKGTAGQKNIILIEKVEPGITAFADAGMARLVLRNLLSNAVKFTPKGGEISISAFYNDKEVKIEVKDNGVGMSKELIASLFRGETNESLPGTNNEKGFGIGLKLCKEFTEENGGRLEVESMIGRGSTVSFTLPLTY